MVIRNLKRICILVMVFNIVSTTFFIFSVGNVLFFDSRLKVDTNSYVEGGRYLVENNFTEFRELYHSPGFQLFMGFFLYVFGENFLLLRLLFLLLFIMVLYMVVRIGKMTVSTDIGYLAGAICSLSTPLKVYTSLVLYEIPMTFLITLMVYLGILTVRKKGAIVNAYVLGLILSTLLFIQPRFILLILIIIVFFLLKRKHALPVMYVFLIGVSTISLPFSLYESIKHDELVIVTDSQHRNNFIALGNNLNATGRAYPHPEIQEPSGIEFIKTYPQRFLWLTKERFMLYWSLRADRWSLNPFYIETFEHLEHTEVNENLVGKLAFTHFIIFLTGCIITIKKFFNTEKNFDILLPLGIIAGTMIIPLVIISSSRYAIPIIPFVSMFQAVAIKKLVKSIK